MKKLLYAILIAGIALHNLKTKPTPLVNLNGKINDFKKNGNIVTHTQFHISSISLYSPRDGANNFSSTTETYKITEKGKLLGFEKSTVNCATWKEIQDLLIDSEKAGFKQSVISGTALVPIFNQDYYTTVDGKKIRNIHAGCVDIFNGNKARYSYTLLTPVYGKKK